VNNGYIKLFRSFKDWYGFGSSKRVHLWITLLMLANHKEHTFLFCGKPTRILPGQFITGRKSLSATTKISESYIEDLLSEFEKQGQLQQQKSNTSRLITIVKWSDYQGYDNGEDNGEDNGATTERTTERQQKDTNKNVKNEKNEKNVNNNIAETISQNSVLLSLFSQILQEKIKVYIDRARAKNKSGVITEGRKNTLLNELINSRNLCNNDEVFGYALEGAIKNDACCVGYVNAIIKNKKTARPRQ